MSKLSQKEDLNSKSLWPGKLLSSFESIFSSEKIIINTSKGYCGIILKRVCETLENHKAL